MRLLVLGYGGWISSPWLEYTSFVVDVDGELYLVECGEGIPRQLMRLGIRPCDLSYVIVTHAHGDHALGLPTLLLWCKYYNCRARVVGLRDVYFSLADVLKAVGMERLLERLEFIEVPRAERPQKVMDTGKCELWAVLADHVVNTIAVKLVEKRTQKSIAYSSDTRPCDRVIELARGSTLLLHEASGLPGLEEEAHAHGHSTSAEAVEIARRSGVRRLMLVHHYVVPPILRGINDVEIIEPVVGAWLEI